MGIIGVGGDASAADHIGDVAVGIVGIAFLDRAFTDRGHPLIRVVGDGGGSAAPVHDLLDEGHSIHLVEAVLHGQRIPIRFLGIVTQPVDEIVVIGTGDPGFGIGHLRQSAVVTPQRGGFRPLWGGI